MVYRLSTASVKSPGEGERGSAVMQSDVHKDGEMDGILMVTSALDRALH